MGRFDGRVALVTGAARGLGREIAAAFAREGSAVVAADLTADGDPAAGVVPVACDVTDADQVAAAMALATERFGPVDVLVNNAGVSTVSPVAQLSERDFDRVVEVNLKGAFLCSRAFAAPGGARRWIVNGAAIVTVASQAGKRGVANIAPYCAAKAAQIGFTRALALELAPAVRVNAVCPGIVETELVTEQVRSQADARGRSADEVRDGWLAEVPMGRFQPASAVAAAVLFLASDEAGEITGEALNVSGGMVMH
jgi:NAD(P)-dependent dehydrogenase (short-subunit alcohol dehydrogenase family)